MNIFHMFKKLCKNMEDIKKTQIEVLEKKMTSNDKNYILAGINSRLDIEEETITKLEGITMETIQTETYTENKRKFKKHQWVVNFNQLNIWDRSLQRTPMSWG